MLSDNNEGHTLGDILGAALRQRREEKEAMDVHHHNSMQSVVSLIVQGKNVDAIKILRALFVPLQRYGTEAMPGSTLGLKDAKNMVDGIASGLRSHMPAAFTSPEEADAAAAKARYDVMQLDASGRPGQIGDDLSFDANLGYAVYWYSDRLHSTRYSVAEYFHDGADVLEARAAAYAKAERLLVDDTNKNIRVLRIIGDTEVKQVTTTTKSISGK